MRLPVGLRGALGTALVVGCLWGGPAGASVPPAPAARAAVTPGASSSSPNAGPVMRAFSGDDGQDIRDIHGPVAPPRRRPIGWLAGALGVAALGAGLLYRRRRRPTLLPHQRALRALEEVRPLLGGDPRAFSFTVSEIVRTYVEASFSLPAAHRTTEELLADLMRDHSPVAAHRDALGNFLLHCDLAKFAGWSLTSADMTALLDSAVAFVRATCPDNASPRAALTAPQRTRAGKGAALA